MFIATVKAVFFYFSTIIIHTEQQRLGQQGHKNRHFKHMYFNFCFLRDTFYKIIVLKQAISSSIIALYSQKHKMLWLSLPYTTNLQYCSMFFVFFFHICSNSNCCFCVQLVKQLFFYIYKEVSGAFSNIAYFFE